jgi:glutamine synthetase
MSLRPFDSGTFESMIAGILGNIRAMTAFLNPVETSYLRLGSFKAPRFVSWSAENRSQLVRIPAASGEYRRAELRSPDPCANPYLAFALMIRAGLCGIGNGLTLCAPTDADLFTAGEDVLAGLEKLPENLGEACRAAASSDFIRRSLPSEIIDIRCGK